MAEEATATITVTARPGLGLGVLPEAVVVTAASEAAAPVSVPRVAGDVPLTAKTDAATGQQGTGAPVLGFGPYDAGRSQVMQALEKAGGLGGGG